MNSFTRLALCAALLLGSVLSFDAIKSAQAQGSPEAAAQQATERWLALVDAGKYGESWDEAAPILKAAPAARTGWRT